MENVEPKLQEFKWGFTGPYGRANDIQRAQYDPVLDSINNFFKENWPEMSDEEKMKAIRKENFPKDPEFTKYGTAKEPASYSESGEAPAKNWGESGTEVFKDAWKITGDEIIKYQKKK